MKKINVYEKVLGLKRDLKMDDFVKIDYPDNISHFPEITVKVFTENIYIPELGSYIIIVWDIKQDKPSVLILSHTLFAALKRWRAEAMQDIISKTFTIVSKTNNGVVYHDIYCRGLLPLLTEEIIDQMDQYINDLLIIEENKDE